MQPASNLESQSQVARFGLRQSAMATKSIQTLQHHVNDLTEALKKERINVAEYEETVDAYEENARAARQIITDLVFKLESSCDDAAGAANNEVLDPHKIIADLREVMEELHAA